MVTTWLLLKYVSVVVATPVPVPTVFRLNGEIITGLMYVYPPVSVLDVVSGLVTTTSACPVVPTGVLNVSCVLLLMVTFVAATPPMVTVDVGEKLVPVTVTSVPPAVGPLSGETLVTVGGLLAVYVKIAVALPEVPNATLFTVMSAVPVYVMGFAAGH